MTKFKLVPVEPTREMILHGKNTIKGADTTFEGILAEMAYKSMLAAAPSPWISAGERLPEIGERVIGFTGEVEEVTYWAPKCGVHDGEAGFCDLFDNAVEVTHWMPLPDAPEVKP